VTHGHRPYISSLHFFGARDHGWFFKIGVADFNGAYRIIDLKTNQVVSTYKEHKGRVLAATSVLTKMAVTTGQDRCIKIWDSRMAKSVVTLVEPNSIGPITHVERLCAPYFVTGSSSSYKLGSGSQLTLWDLRKTS
jgi:WD40 repeat protein